MRVTIVDLTGQLTRVRRQDLERRLSALGTGVPDIDAVEVDLETQADASAAPRRRVIVTLRADHRPVVRVSDDAPTLAGALDLALKDAVREGSTFGAANGDARVRSLH